MKLKQSVILTSILFMTNSVAMADVVLFGQLRANLEVDSKKVGNTKLYNGTRTKLVSPTSRLGFKGSEALSGSLKAIWQVEQFVSLAGGSNGFANRDSYIGLDGKFGRVEVGYVNTPINEWAESYLNPYQHASFVSGPGYWSRNTGNDTKRRRTAVRYYTPNMAGLVGELYVSPSNNAPNNDENVWANEQKSDKALYGAVLDYQHKPSGLFVNTIGAYTKHGNNNPLNKDAFQTIVQFGINKDKYSAGIGYQYAQNVDPAAAFDANAFDTYQKATSTTAATGVQTHAVSKAQEVLATATYKIAPNWRLRATAAYGFDIQAIRTNHDTGTTAVQKVGGNGKYWQGILGAQYTFSKRTDAYTQLGYLQSGKGNETVKMTGFGVGLRHFF